MSISTITQWTLSFCTGDGLLQPQDFTVDDFSGGITDFYLGAPKNRAQVMDNFLILNNRSVKSRSGSVIDNETEDQIPAGNQRIGAIINYNNSDKLLVQSNRKIYYRSTAGAFPYVELVGPVTLNPLLSAGDTSNFIAYAEWNRHLIITSDAGTKPQKIYKDGSSNLQLRTAGLPALASAPTLASAGGSGNDYIYAFHYFFEYTIGTQTFEDAGPVTQVAITNVGAPNANTITISNIPALANGTTDNYDTANIKVKIYRTINDGTDFFFVKEITNGTTSTTDTAADGTIDDNVLIYTTGGVLDNDPPPIAKYVFTVNGFTYYLNLTEDSEALPNDYAQSVQNDPDSVPGQFRDSVAYELRGGGAAGGVPVLMTAKAVYRIEGTYDEFGQGFMTAVEIHDTAGCLSHRSIVKAGDRLFWAGNDGFYMTDGYRVQKISRHLKNSYAAYRDNLSDTKKIEGMYNDLEGRIYWTFQVSETSTDVDACIVLDLEWGVSEESTFTTVSGQESFSPTSITMFNNLWYRADRRGYVFIHSDDYTTDPLVNTSEDADDWGEQTVIWRYKGPGFNFGLPLTRKFVPRIGLKAKNEGDVSIQINGIVDDGRIVKSCKQIRSRNGFEWGDPEFIWGTTSCIWGGGGIIDQWRRFPAGGLRCDYFQVEITNAYTIITNSDTLGQATFNNTTNKVTLDDVTQQWPLASRGYFISHETAVAGTYSDDFEITLRDSDTVLTILDPDNELPSASRKWLLKGYAKGDTLNVLNYSLVWAPLTMSQVPFRSSQLGENA